MWLRRWGILQPLAVRPMPGRPVAARRLQPVRPVAVRPVGTARPVAARPMRALGARPMARAAAPR